MNITRDSGSANALYCELCDYVQFSTYVEFYYHHLNHIRQPLVQLVKLNSHLSKKLQTKSYKINTGVARRSHPKHVPPLKISLIKQPGANQFHIIQKENFKSNHISNSENCCSCQRPSNPSNSLEEYKVKKYFGGNSGLVDVEGKNLIERFGAKISVSRKGKPSSPVLAGNGNGKNDSEVSFPNSEAKTENLLERLSGIGGISISTKSKSSTNGNSDTKSSGGISISSKQKSIDLNELKKLKDHDGENDKKLFDKNIILKKLSGSGSISIAPKSQIKAEFSQEEDKSRETDEQESSWPETQEVFDRSDSGDSGSAVKPKSSAGSDYTDSKNLYDEGNGRQGNENNLENSEQKKFVRVKNSTFSKKSIRPPVSQSPKESLEEPTGTPEEQKEKEGANRKESGIDILERLTDNLNTTVEISKSGENSGDSNSDKMEEPLLPAHSGKDHRSELTASQTEVGNMTSDSQYSANNERNPLEQEQECALLLTPPSSSGQEGENSDFNTLSSHQPDYGESNNGQDDSSDLNESGDAFTSLTNESDSHEANEQQNSFWSDMPNNSNNIDQPQQDPLLTPDNPVSNGENLNQNFLHNFLSEPQPPPNSMPPENSEFMSLDRLAQTQHQQPPPYSMSSNDPNTPMEQLSQQVQRIPNPPPQINVISQHHMQAPQPPQLHTGVPISPQHISPQQPNSFEALGHMQPPMPPPLYQGYNMFNQSFPPQTPQQLPRPPILQQRPHIQPRSFQSLAAPQRPRSRPIKRNPIRLPSPEMVPPKQLRMDPPLQTRPQLPNATAKLPSGITVTPPKKALEANKVANVLASRGITVTPAASRQTNQSSRPQQRNSSPSQAPTLNIGSAVSITSSAQNRGNGGFAVPGPRRSTPIVNHHIDRPERCATVDLTMDDEMPHPQLYRNKAAASRFPCKLCGKIFSSSFTLESHKAAAHRTALSYKCDKCPAQYVTSLQLQQHKATFHKTKISAPDLAIPIVDLNHPGARDQLLKCGIQNYIPMAQLQSNNNGYFGVPIIQLDTAREKAVSNLSILGAGNILVLGKMKALAP